LDKHSGEDCDAVSIGGSRWSHRLFWRLLSQGCGAVRAQALPKKPITYILSWGPIRASDLLVLELPMSSLLDGNAKVIDNARQIINRHLSKVRYDFLRDPKSGAL
jgi:hypothetical protein